jgi:hypothetical protein
MNIGTMCQYSSFTLTISGFKMGKIYIPSLGSFDLFNSMKIKNILVTAIAPFLALSMQPTPSASAQTLSECSVEIVGSRQGSRVNLRDGAGTEFRSSSYLLVGQYAISLNGSNGRRVLREDSEGSIWYYVEYLPSDVRGWIREDFVAFTSSCGD